MRLSPPVFKIPIAGVAGDAMARRCAFMDEEIQSSTSWLAKGITTRVVYGSLFNIGGQAAVLLVSFLATPAVIRLLGVERYGIFVLVNLMLGYMGFADLGMGVASTKYGSEAHANHDDRGEAAVVWTSLLIMALPSLTLAILATAFVRPMVEMSLKLPAPLAAQAAILMPICVIAFIGRVTAGVFNTPQLVRLRIDLNSLINSSGAILQIAIIPIVLYLGGGLAGAICVLASVNIILSIAHFVVSRRLQPRLSAPILDAAIVKPLVRFGSASVISSLANVALSNGERLLLTRFSSVSALAHYSVAFTFASLLAVVPSATSQSMFPAFANLEARSDRSASQLLYHRMLRANLYWAVPALAAFCVLAKPFFDFWAGQEYGLASTLPFYILIAGMLANVLAFVPYSLLLGMGKANLIARCHLAEIPIYVAGASFLAHFFGAPGAALAWTIRVILDATLLFYFAGRLIDYKTSRVFLNDRSYMAAFAVLLAILTPVFLFSAPLFLKVALLALSLAAYAWVMWFWVLSDDEKAWMRQICQSWEKRMM